MAVTNKFIREALEGTGESFDIYGSINASSASSAFAEALNDQMARIAEQEEHFSMLRASRKNTPLTDKIEGLVIAEKQRIVDTHPNIIHCQAQPAGSFGM